MFYESKRKKQRRYQAAVDLQKIDKSKRRRKLSEHAFQILQNMAAQPVVAQGLGVGATLAPPAPSSRRNSSRRASSRTGAEFQPSKRLQDMFDRYEIESSFDDDSSSIDYEALVGIDALEGGALYVELCTILSMCVDDEDQILDQEDGDDIELDIDYDAMLASDSPIGLESCMDNSPLPDQFSSSFNSSLPPLSPRFRSGASSPCVMINEHLLLARRNQNSFL